MARWRLMKRCRPPSRLVQEPLPEDTLASPRAQTGYPNFAPWRHRLMFDYLTVQRSNGPAQGTARAIRCARHEPRDCWADIRSAMDPAATFAVVVKASPQSKRPGNLRRLGFQASFAAPASLRLPRRSQPRLPSTPRLRWPWTTTKYSMRYYFTAAGAINAETRQTVTSALPVLAALSPMLNTLTFLGSAAVA